MVRCTKKSTPNNKLKAETTAYFADLNKSHYILQVLTSWNVVGLNVLKCKVTILGNLKIFLNVLCFRCQANNFLDDPRHSTKISFHKRIVTGIRKRFLGT